MHISHLMLDISDAWSHSDSQRASVCDLHLCQATVDHFDALRIG